MIQLTIIGPSVGIKQKVSLQELGSNGCPVALRHQELYRSPIPHLIRLRQSQCQATW